MGESLAPSPKPDCAFARFRLVLIPVRIYAFQDVAAKKARTERDLIRFTVYSCASVIPLRLTRGGELPHECAA
jgi:hypothetical protein